MSVQQNAQDPFEFATYLLNLPVVCQWMTEHGHDCGAILPANHRLVSVHLREAHGVGGESKEMTTCSWPNCHSRPVQRRSLSRHILSVHLRLLSWTCPQCFKTFSRRGTAHNCHLGGEMLLLA
ncbi:hypothetical protein OG21DRAFT_1315687 [Imleria badia]|nr:hypothetical protein OG21DRAFT_1315687 [Imleria badia]